MDVFEVELCVWNIIFLYNKWTPFIGENYNAIERKQMSKILIKRTTGCAENQGSWPWVNW